jgi:hypothetical protein
MIDPAPPTSDAKSQQLDPDPAALDLATPSINTAGGGHYDHADLPDIFLPYDTHLELGGRRSR